MQGLVRVGGRSLCFCSWKLHSKAVLLRLSVLKEWGWLVVLFFAFQSIPRPSCKTANIGTGLYPAQQGEYT